MKRPGWYWLAALFAGGPALSHGQSDFYLPGTQPTEFRAPLDTVRQCAVCHSQTASGPHDPLFSWQGGMMALAGRDPVFRAAMAIANQDIPGVGEFCLRCHAPKAYLEGRLKPADGSTLTADDLDGVSCALCHKLLDPATPEAVRLTQHVPPGLGNGMFIVTAENVVYGPYGGGPNVSMRPHDALKTPFLASGDVCGTCHDVSNPTLATDVKTQPVYAFGHIERTYSEWKLSAFAQQGAAGTCQRCHYPAVAGGGHPTRFANNPKREYFVDHGAAGGSTWVQDATVLLTADGGVNNKALQRGQEAARALLRTAATLDLTFPGPGKATLRITNHTGHKLPTGYPEGRRMWVHVRYYDAQNALLDEIGRYGEGDEVIGGAAVKVRTLLDPDRTRVYECLPAIGAAQAQKYGKPTGPSFFFVLNDVIAKDNRIPPLGFANAAYAERNCAPVGATYADGQNWDELALTLPARTARVDVRLMYQSVSAEYMKFLAEQDRTSPWGRMVYEVWRETGQCPPEVIAEISRPVGAAATQP